VGPLTRRVKSGLAQAMAVSLAMDTADSGLGPQAFPELGSPKGKSVDPTGLSSSTDDSASNGALQLVVMPISTLNRIGAASAATQLVPRP